MAAQSRNTNPSVETELFTEGYRFDFFQAVRLLERLFPDRQPVGIGVDRTQEVVHFRTRSSLSFPASAIYDVSRTTDDQVSEQASEMTVNFMGLTGLEGTLPQHYTELVIERGRQKDYALRDFLDIFNHRFLSLFYRAWEKYHFPIGYERAVKNGDDYDPFSLCLFDLAGMGTKGLRQRLEVGDELLLYYAGLFAQHPRSVSALQSLLEDYFAVPVAVDQFVGQWLSLAEQDQTYLDSRDGRNNVLGESAIVGDRVWDQQAKFRLRVGPLSYQQFYRILPVGDMFRPLFQLTRFFVGEEYDFEVQLVLKKEHVPQCQLGLGAEHPPLLGWATWLKDEEFPQDAPDAVFTAQLLRLPAKANQLMLDSEPEREAA